MIQKRRTAALRMGVRESSGAGSHRRIRPDVREMGGTEIPVPTGAGLGLFPGSGSQFFHVSGLNFSNYPRKIKILPE